MQTGIQDLGDSVWTLLAGITPMFSTTVLKIIGFASIIITGWFIVRLVEKGIGAVSQKVKSEDLNIRAGFDKLFGKLGVKTDSTGFIALILLVAFLNAVGLPIVSDLSLQLLLWLPDLAAALVILVIGGLASGALSHLVRDATSKAELGNPALLATITKGAVWTYAIVIAVNLIEIPTALTPMLFMVMVGATVLAISSAFKFFGHRTIAQLMRHFYEKGKQAVPKMKEAAQHLKKQT